MILDAIYLIDSCYTDCCMPANHYVWVMKHVMYGLIILIDSLFPCSFTWDTVSRYLATYTMIWCSIYPENVGACVHHSGDQYQRLCMSEVLCAYSLVIFTDCLPTLHCCKGILSMDIVLPIQSFGAVPPLSVLALMFLPEASNAKSNLGQDSKQNACVWG